MKRFIVLLLATCTLPLVYAQDAGPAPPPQNIQMRTDGRCTDVHPGDTIHYSLTIKAVEDAKSVIADLQLRLGGHARLDTSGGLPALDFRGLGGGGRGARDSQDATLYHFTFKVPVEIFGGVYHAVGVIVNTDETAAARDAYRVEVSRHTRDEVAHYCLNVMSSFGGEAEKPEVIHFEPGAVDPKPADSQPVDPTPLDSKPADPKH